MYLASIKDLETASRILCEVFGQYQLIINYKNTETMILNYMNTDTSTNTGHIEDVHEDQGGAQIKHCSATETEKPNLQKHGRAVHENKNANCVDVTSVGLATNEYHCSMCEKTYKYKRGLRRHIKNVHEDQNRVQIEHCNATDTEKPNLRGHGRVVHENKNANSAVVTCVDLTSDKHH